MLAAATMRSSGRRRTLLCVAVLCLLSACAYPRRATHVSPSPPGKATALRGPDGLWQLRILDAELPPRKNTGGEWDSDGTGPDAFVRVIIDGRTVWESEVVEDQQAPKWNVTLPANIVVGDTTKFRLEVWDRDAAGTGDPLGHLASTGLPVTARPDAEASLTLNNLANLRILISDPRPMQGVGLEVEIRPDEMKVLEVEPYSPAARAGIKPGDRIVEVGPLSVSHMADQDALSHLSLSSDRDKKLIVLDDSGKRREVVLDDDPLWLTL